ncbi:MAG TPA: energy transducer TonB, partial [Flavobacteriia bacterium]|nr:energy transducer TonB [Flavobacteriia bacterium]
MPYLDTPYKRKSAVLTTIVMALVLLLIFTFGMTYFDPPKEYGIAVNFGTSDVGSGDTQPTEPLKSASAEEEVVEEVTEQEVEEVPEEVQETPTETAAEPAPAEKVITQDSEESIRIKKQEEAKRKAEAEEKRIRDAERQKKLEAERIEKQRKAAAEKKRKAQEAKRKKLDAMMGGLNNSNGTATGGEGNDNQAGDKGNPNGDPNASGYYGNGGGGSGGNYRLGNRRAVSKPKPTYDCNEEGRVVVSISVDKTGKVISARPGIKGTTNSAPCLLSRAKQAALKTRFNSDSKA